MKNNPGYYKNLSENYLSDIPSPYDNQIEMDLHRTYPEDPEFKEHATLKRLKNVLLSYSRRNVSIGYCQGFNFLAGRLIKQFSSEVW